MFCLGQVALILRRSVPTQQLDSASRNSQAHRVVCAGERHSFLGLNLRRLSLQFLPLIQAGHDRENE